MNTYTNNKICLSTRILVSISRVYNQIKLYQVLLNNICYCIITLIQI